MAAKGKTQRFIYPDREWAAICRNCPLRICVEDTNAIDTCPIRIAKRKNLSPTRVMEIIEITGPNPIKFRQLAFRQTT